MDTCHTELTQTVDELGKLVERMIDSVSLPRHTEDDEAVGPTMEHHVHGHIAQVLDDLLNMLFGPAAPVMRDVKKDVLVEETSVRRRVGF